MRLICVLGVLGLSLMLILAGCGGGGDGTTYTPGQSSAYTVGGVSFNMRYAPSGSFESDDDDISGDPNLPGPVTVANAYWIAETEVTYQLWAEVYDWATTGSGATGAGEYHFQNAGRQGGDLGSSPVGTNQHPVTTVNWRDAMVWCNALTEYYNAQNGTNLACVYTNSDAIVRDSTQVTACGNVVAGSTAKGFRLPTSNEWQLAARYQNGTDWTPGNHVSGDTTSYCYPSDDGTSTVFGNYAWYWENSGNSTHIVGTAGDPTSTTPGSGNANALGLHDMSGNVWEWCFDWYPESEGASRVLRGGSWSSLASGQQVGHVDSDSPSYVSGIVGLRPVRTQ